MIIYISTYIHIHSKHFTYKKARWRCFCQKLPFSPGSPGVVLPRRWNTSTSFAQTTTARFSTSLGMASRRGARRAVFGSWAACCFHCYIVFNRTCIWTYICILLLSLSVLHPEGSAKAAQTKGAATLGWAVQTHYRDTYEQTYIYIYMQI
jgi:hypothetical protein